MELKARMLGANAEMKTFSDALDDKWCEELKARYIKQGIITPSTIKYGPRERPHMTNEAHKKLKQKWIEQGFLQLKGTTNDAFQKRGAEAQVCRDAQAGKNFPKDLRRVEQRHDGQTPGEGNRSTLAQASFSAPGFRPHTVFLN